MTGIPKCCFFWDSALEQENPWSKWRLLLSSYASTLWSSAYTHLQQLSICNDNWSSSTHLGIPVLCPVHLHAALLVLLKRGMSKEVHQSPCQPWRTVAFKSLVWTSLLFLLCDLKHILLLFSFTHASTGKRRSSFWVELW